MADHRFKDSMRLIEHYSLLPFMTPRQYYYPQVVLQFYHSMTSRGAPSPLELQFTIDEIPGVLRAADISAALSLWTVQANAGGYRDWPQSTQREMVRSLALDTTAGPYYSGGSSRLRCSSSTTCCGLASFRFSTTYSVRELSWRLCTGSQRDSGSVPLSW